MKTNKLFKLAICVITPMLLTGCPSTALNLKPGTTAGRVYISDPKISTRERLVNDRYQQDAWLRKELAEADEKQFGFEGAMERRSFQAIISRTGIQADRTKIKLYKLKQDNDALLLKNKAQNIENNRILDQLKFEKAKKALENDTSSTEPSDEKIKAIEDKVASQQSEIEDLKTKLAGQTENNLTIPLSQPKDNSKPPADEVASKIAESSNKVGDLMKDLQPDIVQSGINPSPIDEFHDKLAYRNEIRSKIAENGLDERHDFSGNTLYNLGFDISVLPENDTSAWAMVEVEIIKPNPVEIIKFIENDFDSFLISVERDINSRYNEKLKTLECLNFGVNNGIGSTKEDKQGRDKTNDYVEQVFKKTDECFNKLSDRDKESLILAINDLLNSKPVNPKTSQAQAQTFTSAQQKKQITELAATFKAKSETASSNKKNYMLGQKLLSIVEACQKGGYTSNVNKNFSLEKYCTAIQNGVGGNDSLGLIVYISAGIALRLDTVQAENPALKKLGLEIDDIDAGNKFALTAPYLYLSPVGLDASDIYNQASKDSTRDVIINKIREAVTNNLVNTDMYAYAVTPAETVQRISDVASRQELTDFILSMNALVGSAAGIEQYLNVINSNQGVYNAIRRQPLVVGYTKMQSNNEPINLGWILGPKFSTSNDGKSAQFRHSATQQSVNAQISVPGWWPSFTIKTSYSWIDEHGNIIKKSINKTTNSSKSIVLPANLADITQSLNRFSKSSKPNPQKDHTYSGTLGSPASFLIAGDNLWRSTVVTLGGQKADRIEVLPSMKGIIAYFEKLQLSGKNNLRVWTSDGDADAGTVIVSNTKEKNSEIPPIVKQLSNYVIAGKEANFETTDDLFTQIDETTIEVTTSKIGPWVTCKGFARTEQGFSITIPTVEEFNNSKLKVIDGQQVYFRGLSKDKNPLQFKGQSILYSDGKNNITVKIESSKNENVYKIAVTFPKNFHLAYPAIFKEKNSRKVGIGIDNKNIKIDGACKVDQNNTCKFNLHDESKKTEPKPFKLFVLGLEDELGYKATLPPTQKEESN